MTTPLLTDLTTAAMHGLEVGVIRAAVALAVFPLLHIAFSGRLSRMVRFFRRAGVRSALSR